VTYSQKTARSTQSATCYLAQNIHRVSKNCAFLFRSELCQISTNFNKFWKIYGKVADFVCCINIFHLTWPTSPPYLVKLRCSKLLHNVEIYRLQQTIWRLN